MWGLLVPAVTPAVSIIATGRRAAAGTGSDVAVRSRCFLASGAGFVPGGYRLAPDPPGRVQKQRGDGQPDDHIGPERAGEADRDRCQHHAAIGDEIVARAEPGRATSNPLTDLNGALIPHSQKSFPHVSQEELPELVQAIEHYHNPLVRIGLKLLLMTALWPREMRQARWEEIDLEAAIWKLPVERMKMGWGHRGPLPTQALAELRQLHVMTG